MLDKLLAKKYKFKSGSLGGLAQPRATNIKRLTFSRCKLMTKHQSFSEKTESQFFAKLEERGVQISPEAKKSIKKRIQEISSYVPKVGVFGKTGVGKSSLCNALFGQDICSISDVQACTRDPQEVLLSIGGSGQGIKLLDVPGVGEDRKRDDEYDALYKKLLPELDLIFWVFKGDDRANASDEDFYKRLIRPYIDAGKPFIAVIACCSGNSCFCKRALWFDGIG